MPEGLIGVAPVTFLVTATLLILTPGQDMTLVLKNTVGHGRSAGLRTAGGLLVGVTVHILAAVIGLSALLLASATAFTIVKLLGAAYLAYLGVRMILATFRQAGGDLPIGPAGRAAFLTEGIVSAVLNPKLAVFFLTFLPQFVDPDRMPQASMLAHGAVFIVIAAMWLVVWVALLDRMAGVLRRDAVRRWTERVAGGALIALGARLAFSQR